MLVLFQKEMLQLVSQNIDIKKVGREVSLKQKKKQIGSPEKEVLVSSRNNLFINPNESLATSGQITAAIQRLPAPLVMFLDEFIGGLIQDMLNADAAAPSYDLIQVFNRELNHLNNKTVLLWQNLLKRYIEVFKDLLERSSYRD